MISIKDLDLSEDLKRVIGAHGYKLHKARGQKRIEYGEYYITDENNDVKWSFITDLNHFLFYYAVQKAIDLQAEKYVLQSHLNDLDSAIDSLKSVADKVQQLPGLAQEQNFKVH